MANADLPFGLRATNNPNGDTPRVKHYTALASTTFYEGQPVALNTTGHVTTYTDALALTGNIIGVTAAPMSSTATDRSIPIFDDPLQEFEIQSDDATIAALNTYLYRLFDVTNPNAGNATTLQSTCELTGASGALVAGTSAATMRILTCVGASPNIENTNLVTNSRYIVKITPANHIRALAGMGLSIITTNIQFDGRDN